MTSDAQWAIDRSIEWVRRILIVLILGVTVIPIVYVFSVSIQSPTEFFSYPHLIPQSPTADAWIFAFQRLQGPLVNSFLIATGTAIISLLITIPSAYIFGRRDFPGKKYLFYLVVLTMLSPYLLLIIPITSLWYELGLFNTILGLWISYQVFVTPFAIWILRDYFEQLPHNLEEAAQVYGCTNFSAFIRVILPLAIPAIFTVGFLSFIVGWNDYLFSNMLTTGTGPRPAVVELFIQTGGSETRFWGRLMALTLMVGIPPTILYMFVRKFLAESLSI